MKKTILAVLASLPILVATLGAQAATAPNYVHQNGTIKLISTNASGSVYEISPIHPTKYWSTWGSVPLGYGMEAKLELSGGKFVGNYHNEEFTLPATNQKVVITRVSNTEEGLMPLTPGMENNKWPIAIESSQPHVFVWISKYVSEQYLSMIISPIVAQEKPTFTYPVSPTPLSHTTLQSFFYNLVTETPQVGYLTDMKVTTNKSKESVFHFTYRDTPAQFAYVKTTIPKILAKIITPGMDVYAKEKAVNDWIATNVKYDYSLNQAYNSDYSALTNHVTECQGIAELTYQMMTTAGISTKFVTGNVKNAAYEFRGHPVNVSWLKAPGGHMWNQVDLNGKWYQLDLTPDLSEVNKRHVVGYNFFNLTSAQLAHTHIWNRNGLPVANTNFVSVLQHSKSKQDQQILQEIER
jgi:transglutaminase-like putative cysteine protease